MLEDLCPVPLAVVVDVAIVSELNELGLVDSEVHHPELLGLPQILYQAVYVLRGYGFVSTVDVVAQDVPTGVPTNGFEEYFGGVGVLVLVAQARLPHHHPPALLPVEGVHVQAVRHLGQRSMMSLERGGWIMGELACAGPAQSGPASCEGGKTQATDIPITGITARHVVEDTCLGQFN